MILPEKSVPPEYECRMLSELRHSHLLKMAESGAARQREYAFAVSRGVSLQELAKRREFTYEDVRRFFSELSEALEETEEYLLDRNHLVMDPVCIYGFPDFSGMGFCCHPGYQEDFFEGIKEIVEFLVQHVDHTDRRAAQVLYECCRVCEWPNYRFDDLMAAVGAGLRDEEEEMTEPEAPKPVKRHREEENSHADAAVPVERGTFFLRLAVCAAAGGGLIWQGLLAENADWRVILLLGIVMLSAIAFSVYERIRLSREGDGGYSSRERILPGESLGKASENWTLRPLAAGQDEICLPSFPLVVGRMKEESDIFLDDPLVNRIHARLEKDGEGLWIIDCRSVNGTLVNGKRLEAERREPLTGGDVVAFADLVYEVVSPFGQD